NTAEQWPAGASESGSAPNSPLKKEEVRMIGTTLGIGSSQLGQPNPWGAWPYGAQTIGAQPFNQQQYGQPLQQIQQLLNVLPLQVQQLQQLQQLQQHQHSLQQHQLHQLQQLLQLVPQQLFQLQQLVQLLPQQLQQIQQLVQFLPQQIHHLQQQLLAHQTPFGAASPGFSQPFGAPFAWSAAAQGLPSIAALHPFGVPSATGQVM